MTETTTLGNIGPLGTPGTPEESAPEQSRAQIFFSELGRSSAVISVLAVLLAFLAGGALVAASNSKVHQAMGSFFQRPLDALGAIWDAAAGTYVALFRGSIYNFTANSFDQSIRAFTETLTATTPLLIAGLALAISFRAGLFNIGGSGQMIAGILAASFVGLNLNLDIWIQLPLTVICGALGGAVWGGLVGWLKARTGANEVIVTIMFNYIAAYFLAWLLTVPGYQRPGGNNPITQQISISSQYPNLFGGVHRLHAGIFVAIVLIFVTWWLFNRSTRGFQFRAIGLNQNAAKVAGMNVNRNFTYVMAVSGAFMGLAGTALLMGTEKVVTSGIAGTYGFDAITVALLGRNKPWGVAGAALLMGALRAGAGTMQAAEGIPVDIVAIVQSMIVLFIAAPPLVRSIFRLPTPRKEA
ncbi:MAG: ABC transporter permease [Microbacteriaceae bacterium]